MAFAFSHWDGGSLDWMQHGVCSGGCQSSAQQVYSNLQFWTAGNSPDEEDNTQPTTYTYGNACMGLDDDDCATVDCAVCKMSWPTDTTFNPPTNDPDAQCRCELEVDPLRPVPTDFTFGNDCASLTQDACAEIDCEICKMSWPTDSPYLFPDTQDPYSMCRCEQERQPSTDFTYGNACSGLDNDDCANVDCAVCKMSWPTDTMFNPTTDDPEARCRCELEVDPARPVPTDFTYGESCASLTQDACAEIDCEICSMSWPTDSPYLFPVTQDPYSMCRCEQERQPTTDFTYGDSCAALTTDDCANVDCAVCKMSWPTDTMFNPTTDDPEARCRCETEVDPERPVPTDFTYGESCASLTDGECGDVDCEICSMSWPTDSPYLDPWTQDPYSICRCQQERVTPTPGPDPNCVSW